MRTNIKDCEYREESPTNQQNSLKDHLERAFRVTDLDPFKSFALGDDLEDIPGWPNHSSTHDQQLKTLHVFPSPESELKKRGKSSVVKLKVSPQFKRGLSSDREVDSVDIDLFEQPLVKDKSIPSPDQHGPKLGPLKSAHLNHQLDSNETLSEMLLKRDQEESHFTIELVPLKHQTSEAMSAENQDLDISNKASPTEESLSRLGHCTHLPELCSVLIKVFQHETLSVSDYQNLSNFEQDLLNSVIQRKFLRNFRTSERILEIERRVNSINAVIQMKPKKRHEECYKYVLARVLKHLKRSLSHLDSSQDAELYCYEHYFGQTAKDLGLNLSEFFYPLSGSKQKRFNFKYFGLIFQSKPFIAQVRHYVSNLIEKQYDSEVARKLHALVHRWDKMIRVAGDKSSLVEKSIKEYLSSNKRCKLPWTKQEMAEATLRFKKLLNQFSIVP